MQNYYCDEHAFSMIYNQHQLKLKHFLLGKCGCLCDAEDLMHETFFKLWKNREKIEVGKEASYLFTIAQNLFIDKTRRQKVRNTYNNQLKTHYEVETPDFLLELKEEKKKLEHTIAAMPEKAREVFIMNKIEEKTYNEIANTLCLSVKAIEKRMSKALYVYRQSRA